MIETIVFNSDDPKKNFLVFNLFVGAYTTLSHGQMSPVQGNNSCQQNISPIKTRRMRHSLPQSPTKQITSNHHTMQPDQRKSNILVDLVSLSHFKSFWKRFFV
jgi:hypothetical protein